MVTTIGLTTVEPKKAPDHAAESAPVVEPEVIAEPELVAAAPKPKRGRKAKKDVS